MVWGLPDIMSDLLVIGSPGFAESGWTVIGIMVLTLLLVIPLVESYGLNLIWFGEVVVKLLEIGLITPPVGPNVFVLSNVVGKQPHR